MLAGLRGCPRRDVSRNVLALAVGLLTAMGRPVQVQAQAATPAVEAVEDKVVKARPLPLDAVRLTGGPLKAAQDADGAYLLRVDADRALSALRRLQGWTLRPSRLPVGTAPSGRN